MKKIIIIAAIVLIIVAFVIGFVSFSGNTVKEVQTGDNVKEFTVQAYRFGYSPDKIKINKGDKVKINIDNTDTLHGIRIPELGIKGNEVVEFTANQTGEFVWYCTNMCGEGHRAMQGKLIVT